MIASGILAAKRIKPFVSPEIHYIYSALAKPHFDYCSTAWGSCGKTLLEISQLQNHAARILTSSPYATDVEYLLHNFIGKI